MTIVSFEKILSQCNLLRRSSLDHIYGVLIIVICGSQWAINITRRICMVSFSHSRKERHFIVSHRKVSIRLIMTTKPCFLAYCQRKYHNRIGVSIQPHAIFKIRGVQYIKCLITIRKATISVVSIRMRGMTFPSKSVCLIFSLHTVPNIDWSVVSIAIDKVQFFGSEDVYNSVVLPYSLDNSCFCEHISHACNLQFKFWLVAAWIIFDYKVANLVTRIF